jgi:hypothetical protein
VLEWTKEHSLIVLATFIGITWSFVCGYGAGSAPFSAYVKLLGGHIQLSVAKARSLKFADDGSSNAPPAPIQRSMLLTKYSTRPPWKVAGVDYPVGVPAGTVLTDWQKLKAPGISIVGNMVRIDNTNGVQISNVDFSLHGGAILYINNSNNTIVTNCNFKATTPADIIQLAGSSTGLTVKYSIIDGAGTAFNGSGLIGVTGNVTIEYNWLKNFPQHAVETNADLNLTMKYNLIENGAMRRGAHLNFLQLGQGGSGYTAALDIEFNTTYQQKQAASGEGFQFYYGSTGNTIASTIFANNVMVTDPGFGTSYNGSVPVAMSYLLHGNSGTQYPTALKGTATIYDNYFDITSAYGVFYPNSFSGWSIYNNSDMVTGAAIKTLP